GTAIVNPFAIPPSITPVRPFPEFASGLVTGASVNGLVRYEDPVANPVAIFADVATIPVHPWKSAPTKGHLMGFARRPDNTVLDTATVTIENLDTGSVRIAATDGGGFYGAVDLEPGSYRVRAVLGSTTLYACSAVVAAGLVTTADITAESAAPPVTTATVTPVAADGQNGWYLTSPTLSLAATGGCAGIARTEYSLDNGASWLTYNGPITIAQEGTTAVLFRSVDLTGAVEATQSRTFMVDLNTPVVQLTADPSAIWPPGKRMTDVTITGTGSDTGSGVSQVSYVVTDEYGLPLSIGTRALSGNSANWIESLMVEAQRNGGDLDGRLYTITATISDVAGRTSTATTSVVVLHDRRFD
ncbi:MAG TPA: carboxypeptidase regulatory-like domain-containing protein, partial [Pyrinomonadaceae bacterium]